MSGTPAASGTINPTFTVTDANSYSITTSPIPFTVATAMLTVAANNASATAATTCTLAGVLAGDTANVSCPAGTASFSDANVGTAKTVTATGITLSGSAAGNYLLSGTSATATANITVATVTPSVTIAAKVYDTPGTSAPSPRAAWPACRAPIRSL